MASSSFAPSDEGFQSDPLEDLRSRHELAALLQGTDVGLALFDDTFKLVVCNSLYRAKMGFRDDEARVGASLADLMMLSSRREASSGIGMKRNIENVLDRLRSGHAFVVQHSTPAGHPAEISRRVTSSGMVVETVREVPDSGALGSATNFALVADAARTMMVQALEVMGDGFALYDSQDRLIVFNSRYAEYNAIIADLLHPGVTYEVLVSAIANRGGFAMPADELDAFVANRVSQHSSGTSVVEFQRSDGRWYRVDDRKTDDGCVVTLISDFTHIKLREIEHKNLSRQLQAHNTHFNAALNNMAQGLCLFDREDRLLVANERFMSLYGFSPEVVKPGVFRKDIIRHSVDLGNLSQEEFIAIMAGLRPGMRTTTKQRMKHGRVVAVMTEPMAGGGYVATYTDITEGEVRAAELREHAIKLERSNRDLEEFAYVASHDLQEPLRKIEAFGDRLAKRYGATLPEDGQMFIERMQNAANRMRRLINDLLGYSRVMSKAKPQKSVDLNVVLAEVLGDLQVRIEEAGADIRSTPLPSVPGDPVQFGQLFQNLLSNALKFVRPGVKPVIEISAALEETAGPRTQPIRTHKITIVDNGIGFDNRYKDQIFKIFQRLHGRLDYEGTGVGLATVRKIIERHKGDIDCDGRPGEGATFIVSLPFEGADAAAEPARTDT